MFRGINQYKNRIYTDVFAGYYKFMYLTLKLCVLIRARFYVAATPMGGFSFWGKKNPSLKLGGCHVNCQASPQIGTK